VAHEGFGSCASTASEPRQARKGAAIRYAGRVPQIHRNPSSATVSVAMAYQVLARKWRPQNFSSLVGQEPIVTALRNALAEGRIAHAYLFSGIRGVGKTTAARVLAKALNCERGPAADPCNECTACIEIARGSDLDVLEVDAATYSKVEQVRDLTESLRYGPARDRYKVVVLDEVHRLSRQAFDALLKIVEEPPPYLVFIFATTEIEAVPATILSRCQEFQFRRVSAVAVSALLRQICESESIQATDSALRLLARAGEGSVRDAVALLDQLATFGSGTITDEAAIRLLGGLDTALFRRLLEAILSGDAVAVSRDVRHVEDEGWDARHVYGQFLAYCRDALHLSLGADPRLIDLSLEEAQSLAELARSGGYENLLRLLNQLLASEPIVRRTELGALAVEIAWLRAAELPKLVRVEELLGGGSFADRPQRPTAGAPAAAVPSLAPPRPSLSVVPAAPTTRASGQKPEAMPRASAPASAPPRGDEIDAPMRAPDETAPASPPAEPAASRAVQETAPPQAAQKIAPAPAAESGTRTGTLENARTTDAVKNSAPAAGLPPAAFTAAAPPAGAVRAGTIPEFMDEISARKQPLAAHLEQATSLQFENGRLRILVAPGDVTLSSRLRQPANRETLDEAVAKIWGSGTVWEFAEGPRPAPQTGESAAPPPPAESSEALNPAVQTLLDIFGGKVEAVEEIRGAREE
jgi:DNA polymerase-3 subunit gamma/tau